MIGVARDGKYQSLTEQPRNYMYLAVLQSYWPSVILHVRTEGDPLGVLPAVTAEVHAIDPALPLFDVRTIEDHRRLAVFLPRLATTLLGLFGGLALLLAVVGLYGVVAFAAAQRRREIGVRIALGATRGEVIGLIVRQGFVVALAGIAVGVLLAAVAARLLQEQLIHTSPADPLSFGATAILLLVVAAAACVIPASRAARLEPLTALRGD